MDLAALDVRVGDRRDRVPDVLPDVHADIFNARNGNRRRLCQIKLPLIESES